LWISRQSQHEGCENTFAVTLAANQNKQQKQNNHYDHTRNQRRLEHYQSKLKQKWAKLTDDDLQFVEGKQEELVGRIQKRTAKPAKRSKRPSRNPAPPAAANRMAAVRANARRPL